MVRNEFRLNYRRLILGLLFNVVATVLLYLFFSSGLGKILPRINYYAIDQFVFPTIIGFINAMIALGLPCLAVSRYLEISQGDLQRLPGASASQIYSGFCVNHILIIGLNLVVSTLILAIISGQFPEFGLLILFWLYSILALSVFIQIGFLIGLQADRRNHFYWILLIFTPLLLLSGMIVPTHFYTGPMYYFLSVLPSTALIEGGRMIILKQPFNILYVFGLLLMNIFLFIGVVYIFTRKLYR
jgi:ABC-type multidrug transport system permease subunit